MPFLISLIALLTLPVSSGLRCIIPGTPTQELSKAKAVFTGKVVERKYVSGDQPGQADHGERLVIKLAVERVWKGQIGDHVLMYTSEVRQPNGYTWTDAEDFFFDDGKEYLVYAYGNEERLETSACTRTRELEKAEHDVKELGEGYEPARR